MKKFKFTLQTVHNVREMREEKEHLVLTQMQNEVENAAERIRQIEQMRQEAIEKYTSRLQSGQMINAYELEMNSNHIATLDKVRREAEEVLEQKKQACRKQGETVAVATRAVKITNRLRETQELRHKSESERQEQTAIDELVSANFARRMTQ
jgi:flagellar export protein FliJ